MDRQGFISWLHDFKKKQATIPPLSISQTQGPPQKSEFPEETGNGSRKARHAATQNDDVFSDAEPKRDTVDGSEIL